jgi:hypothetical protein
MGAIDDAMELREQDKLDQQQAANNARLYNPDGSAKANDFVMPGMPQSTFPARLADAGSELSVDTGQVGAVRTNMAANLRQLEATLSQLVSNGDFGAAIGGWTTADGFGSNTLNAYEGITQFMQALNSAYDSVTGNLAKTVVNYDDTETTITSAASRIGSEAAPSGSVGG